MFASPFARWLTVCIAASLFIAGCGASSTNTPVAAATDLAPTLAATAAPPTNTPLPPASATLAALDTATPSFDIQKLVGVWNVSDVYFRFSATGQYSVGEHITRFVVGEPEAHIVIEGNLIKLYNEAGCATTDEGVYRISFAPDGSHYTLTLVRDSCAWRRGGQVPAGTTYRKLEVRVLPGTYQAELTQAEAEAAGGGDLLKYVGSLELQLNAGGTFALRVNNEPLADGKYVSADVQFTLDHRDLCPGIAIPIYNAKLDEAGVKFFENPSYGFSYDCPAMVLILTGRQWTKQ